jgi:predicted lipoprotein with Yx(FWY)xxD motif
MRRSIAILVACFAAIGAGCGESEMRADGDSAAARPASPSTARSGSHRAAIIVMNSRYGRMLFDGNGRALYLFTREHGSTSRCYGACAKAWPPFLVRRAPAARRGVDADLIGTTRRRDGRRQATYRGHPLYYYVTDRRRGQVTCQDVTEFGGTWLVVSPRGRAIR